MARHTIASAAWFGASPDDVLGHLNMILRRRDFDDFLTAAYGELFAGDDGVTLSLAVAGHPLPIHVRRDGTASTCGKVGTLIGCFDSLRTSTTPVLLAPGDTLVLYTDGATDVAPPYALDEEAMVALVGRAVAGAPTGGADAVANIIEVELGKVLPLDQRFDDIAVLVLQAR